MYHFLCPCHTDSLAVLSRQQQQLLIVGDIVNCVTVSDIVANVQHVDQCYIDFVCV